MLERDLQEYLFAHPEIILPDEVVLEKSREVFVEGKRIDLLLRTDAARYIVELKAVPLTREHIGQVVEYYGLMRGQFRDGIFKMVLVAPAIAEFRKVLLEEIGIRCLQIPSWPSSATEIQELHRDASDHKRRECVESEILTDLPNLDSISYDSLVTCVTRQSLAISHRIYFDSILGIQKSFAEYEVVPFKMMRAESPDITCSGVPNGFESVPPFVKAGAWWAYNFGESEKMPKNDVPNISAMAMPWSLDLTINAELRTSQSVMKHRIAEEPSRFDKIVAAHGGLQFQILLKLEHQPRFYHWIPIARREPGNWTSASLLEEVDKISTDYSDLRSAWINWIEENRTEMSRAQILHMEKQNRAPNLALRLVRPFGREDPFWSLPYEGQVNLFTSECRRLKPFIDFFR